MSKDRDAQVQAVIDKAMAAAIDAIKAGTKDFLCDKPLDEAARLALHDTIVGILNRQFPDAPSPFTVKARVDPTDPNKVRLKITGPRYLMQEYFPDSDEGDYDE